MTTDARGALHDGRGRYAPKMRAETSRGLGDLLARFTVDAHVVEREETFHVGTLNAHHRKNDSYEGDGLSVSDHPDDWAKIARLGGSTFTVSRVDGRALRFVSWHDVPETERDVLREWGRSRGWMEQVSVFQMTYYDDEYERDMCMEFATLEEAEEEAGWRDDATIVTVSSWKATGLFPQERVDDSDPSDLLLGVYLAAERPDIDGVWWEDEYAPHLLSCPRAVIVQPLDGYQFV